MYYENMPLNEFFDLYIQERSVDFKERTIDNKRDIFERFISPYFSDTPLVKLTSEDINYWKSVIRAKGYSDSYERLIYNNFRSIFSFAAQHYGVNNPFKAVSPIGSFKRHRLDFWDETTFLEFLSYFKEGSRGYVIFETAYYTGMRLGEILALCRDQIDFSNKIIFVDNGVVVEEGPLICYQYKVSKYNRHERIAWLKTDFRNQKVYVGFTVRPRKYYKSDKWELTGVLADGSEVDTTELSRKMMEGHTALF